jgi:hypothetical protein
VIRVGPAVALEEVMEINEAKCECCGGGCEADVSDGVRWCERCWNAAEREVYARVENLGNPDVVRANIINVLTKGCAS